MIRSFFNACLLVLISILLSLGAAEGLVRFFAPQQLVLIRPDIWCPQDGLGWKHCANVDTLVNSGEGLARFRTDNNGYRLTSWKGQIPERRILALGDSFVEAIQVNDEETIPSVLETLLRKRRGWSVQVVNSGVGQWDPNHYLLQARKEILRQAYHMGLVFLYMGNDVVSKENIHFEPRQPDLQSQTRPVAGTFKRAVIGHFLYPVNNLLRTHSHLFIFLKHSLSSGLMRMGLTGNFISPIFLRSEKDSADWATTVRICSKIKEEFESRNIPVLFIFIPTSYQIEADEFEKLLKTSHISSETVDLEQPNNILGKMFTSSKIPFVDPLRGLRSQASSQHPLYGRIDNHLNRDGYRALAEIILPVVETRLP